MKRLLITAASVAAALALTLSGCTSDDNAGGSDDGQGDRPPSGEDPFNNVIRYAECLRDEGLEITIHPGDGFTMPRDTDPAKREAAEAACRSVAPPGMYAKPSAEELDRYV